MASPPILGFDQRFAPANQFLIDPDDPTYAGMDAGSRALALKMLSARMITPEDAPPQAAWTPGQASQNAVPVGPPLTGPQQSYANRASLPASSAGQSGQAGQMQSSYNNSPYSPGPQGTIANTGAPQGSQGELVSAGERGWNIYPSTPTWTGSPLSQSPPARDEGDFKAPPPISGPNPVQQRQAQIRQALIQQAFANMPRGYKFKLG